MTLSVSTMSIPSLVALVFVNSWEAWNNGIDDAFRRLLKVHENTLLHQQRLWSRGWDGFMKEL
jgi:hypothetical protein